jgi:hypothetical protein
MPRYLPLLAWCFTWLVLILIIVINAAGTGLNNGGRPADETIKLSNTPILSVSCASKFLYPSGRPYHHTPDCGLNQHSLITILYTDVNPVMNYSLVYKMYLNGACFAPLEVYSEEYGPYCGPSHAGGVYDLKGMMEVADNTLVGLVAKMRNSTAAATQQVTMERVGKVAPFVFYCLAAVNCCVLVFLIPRTFRGQRRESLLCFSAAAVCPHFTSQDVVAQSINRLTD